MRGFRYQPRAVVQALMDGERELLPLRDCFNSRVPLSKRCRSTIYVYVCTWRVRAHTHTREGGREGGREGESVSKDPAPDTIVVSASLRRRRRWRRRRRRRWRSDVDLVSGCGLEICPVPQRAEKRTYTATHKRTQTHTNTLSWRVCCTAC